jgi:prepilin-type N-terminal cleavage/methylation domain-containing protein
MFSLCISLAKDERSGFTLIETLIAIVILTMAFLGLYTMIIGTIRGITFNNNRMIATTMALDRMERIKNADYDTVVAANYPPESYNTIAEYEQFQRTVSILEDNPSPAMKTITVVVSWRNTAGATRNAMLNTIIAQW